MAQQEDQDGELEYHITFPSPYPSDLSHDAGVISGDLFGGEDEREARSEKTDEVDMELQQHLLKEPVVIVLGWSGCSDQQLARYSEMYDSKSCITIRYTASTDTILYHPTTLKPAATKLLELLIDLNLEGNPLFVHVFSKGGAYVYRYLTELVHRDKKYWHIKIMGSIFDSGPAKYRLMNEYKEAMSLVMNRMILVRLIIAIYYLLYFLGMVVIDSLRKLPWRQYDIHEAIKNDPSKAPQLFLYSTADMVALASDIAEIVKYRQENGRDVKSVCWDDSGHVQHFSVHRESYIKTCHDFLDMCMGSIWNEQA